jgi:type I restriction enzyme S subunit
MIAQNKIEKLIAELCPQGVGFTELGKMTKYSEQRVDANHLNRDNYVGVDNLLPNKKGKTISNYVPLIGRLTHFESGDILIGNIRPYLKKIWLSDCVGGTNGDVLVVQINERQKLLPEFLYYLLSADDFFNFDMQFSKGAKMPRGDKDAILKYKIPIPPLPIQVEIVKILDIFTELEAELVAELEARKRQYEHFRTKLLSFGKDVKHFTLGEVMTIVRGASPRPIQSFFQIDGGGVNWIKIGDVDPSAKYVTEAKQRISKEGAKKSRFLKKGNFILSNSMSFGRPYILGIDGCVHDGWIAMSDFEKSFLPDFLYHLLRSDPVQKYWQQKASSGTVQNLNADIVRSTKVPIPSLEEQKKISLLLDKFDALVNDISIGLPAELKARRQQYEYYRNKLLTFKKYES